MEYHIMNKTEYDPKWAICTECDGQGKFEDGQGQWWLCRTCAGYGSPAARLYGEKHPEDIKPASLQGNNSAVDFDTNKARTNVFEMSTRQHPTDFAVEWSDIAASPWGSILYSVEADKGFR